MRVRTFPLVVGAALSLLGFGQGLQAQVAQAQSAPSLSHRGSGKLATGATDFGSGTEPFRQTSLSASSWS